MRDDDRPPTLSFEGERRRESILTDAVRAATRLRRRRKTRRAIAIAAVPLVAIGLSIWAMSNRAMPTAIGPAIAMPTSAPVAPIHSLPSTVDRASTDRPVTVVSSDATAVIRIVGDDPTLGDRLRAPDVATTIGRIDDDQLIRALDASGLRAGVATVGGTTRLYVDGQAVR